MSHTAPRTGRPRIFVLAVALFAAAGTLAAQRPLPPSELAAHFERANRMFAEARYEDAYKQYNQVFSSGDAALAGETTRASYR